ncbi:MAG: arginine decarboxylase [Chitinophagales bacterium]
MINRYADLIDQTFYFPQDGFKVVDGYLYFNDVPLKELIDTYGTPFRLTYLPKITSQIQKAKGLFNKAIEKHNYQGNYRYCYCTKSSHFKHVLEEVMKNGVQLETSSAFDIDLLRKLYIEGKVQKNTIIVNNGFKNERYLRKISELINDGFYNVVPVCDNAEELNAYEQMVEKSPCNVGLRVATEEEPNFEFYTSRLGIRHSEVIPFYQNKIANNPKFRLRMLHFFVDKGIRDNMYYWGEFKRTLKLYCALRKVCPTLKAINIGGGMPIKNSLGFEYDYEYMISEIVSQIKDACDEENIPHPEIFTEFGKYTVGESGAAIFSVLGQKQQNDSELWYMIDNSLINTLPDTWGIGERFILLPINKWNNEFGRVNIGGLSCDNADYYNSEVHVGQVYMPRYKGTDEQLYLGFFHTGAYQEALGGYGGVQHCLIPSPQHIIADLDENGQLRHWQHAPQQTAEDMLRILGY